MVTYLLATKVSPNDLSDTSEIEAGALGSMQIRRQLALSLRDSGQVSALDVSAGGIGMGGEFRVIPCLRILLTVFQPYI
jgi:hypothetical protein